MTPLSEQIGDMLAGNALTYNVPWDTLSRWRAQADEMEHRLAAMEVDIADLRSRLTHGIRKDDSDTSIEAWRLTRENRRSHKARILRVFLQNPRRSFDWEEVADITGIGHRSSPWKRLGELEVAGYLTVMSTTHVSPNTGKLLKVYGLRADHPPIEGVLDVA